MSISTTYKLMFPRLCIGCHVNNMIKENNFCVSCYEQISFTNQLEELGVLKNISQGSQRNINEFEKRFYGRVTIQEGAALYWYAKGDIVEEMIYNLKYKGQKIIAKTLGNILGKEMINTKTYDQVDCIIPIPIHDKKKRKRGFNQSNLIATAVSEITSIPVVKNCIFKKEHTVSQTRKTRIQRLVDITDNFGIRNMEIIRGKHVLILDDVLTTGATLEAAARIMFDKAEVKSVSMVTIGIGKLD